MSIEWLDWCRLCAKEDAQGNINIFPKHDFPAVEANNDFDGRSTELDLALTIEQYFSVHITGVQRLPKMLCTDCLTYVTTLANYAERVARVQEMYAHLQQAMEADEPLDLPHVLQQFGLQDEERQQTSPQEHLDEDEPKMYEFYEPVISLKSSGHSQFETDYEKSENSEEEAVEEIQIEVAKDPFLDSDELTSEGREQAAVQSPPLKIRRLTKKRPRVSTPPDDKAAHRGKLKILRCPHCPSVYVRLKYLRNHLNRNHNNSGCELMKRCDQCPRTFTTELQLQNHVRIHLPVELKKTIPCPHCAIKCSSNELLRSHIKFVHENERPFICEECGKTLRTSSSLKTHMLTHTDAAPYECEICKKGFKDARRLKKHSEIHDPKKHICGKCGAELNSRATLVRHLLVHSDKLEHKCDYCGKAFRTAKSLKSHLILHTGLKPYSCDFCERTFANGPNCRSHKKKAHPEELAALEASGGGKIYTPNIPKLEVLRAVTKAAENLAPVATKKSGNFLHGNPPQKAAKKPANTKLPALHTRDPGTVLLGPNDLTKLPPINQICSRLYKDYESPP